MARGVKTKAYENTNFVTGESPVTHDVNADLGWNGSQGYIMCDGAGDIKVEISPDGTTWGGQHTMKSGESIDLTDMDVDSIRITHVTDSSYRIMVY